MKNITFSELSETQSNKLRKLRQMIEASGKHEVLDLIDLGIDSSDLTPEFLLAAPSENEPCTLQFMAEYGYLPLIPSECLTEDVLWAKVYIHTPDAPSRYNSILEWCIGHGYYPQLQAEYQTRDALRRNSPFFSPLYVAAYCGRLSTLPLHTLLPGDLSPDILSSACRFKNDPAIRKFVQAKDIDAQTMANCFIAYYSPPKLFLEMVDARTLLGEVSDLLLAGESGNALAVAVKYGHIAKIDTSLFLHHFEEAKWAIQAGKKKITSDVSILLGIGKRLEKAEERILAADTWLAKLAQTILAGKSKP